MSPFGPWGPVAPVSPFVPWGPSGPVAPVSPFCPWGPVVPVSPFGPWGPVAPVSPFGPWGPSGPVAPVSPLTPGSPMSPFAPGGIVKLKSTPSPDVLFTTFTDVEAPSTAVAPTFALLRMSVVDGTSVVRATRVLFTRRPCGFTTLTSPFAFISKTFPSYVSNPLTSVCLR